MKLTQYKQELRKSSKEDLLKMIDDERKNLFMGRRDAATKQLENTMRIRHAKKNIARILTVLRERELESAKGNE
ncbi:MAG: 50S ribosomal protein L29 [Armatimonadota bacterium]